MAGSARTLLRQTAAAEACPVLTDRFDWRSPPQVDPKQPIRTAVADPQSRVSLEAEEARRCPDLEVQIYRLASTGLSLMRVNGRATNRSDSRFRQAGCRPRYFRTSRQFACVNVRRHGVLNLGAMLLDCLLYSPRDFLQLRPSSNRPARDSPFLNVGATTSLTLVPRCTGALFVTAWTFDFV